MIFAVTAILAQAAAAPAPAIPGVSYAHSKATVVLFVASTCPCSMAHVSEIKTLADTYRSKGVQFVAVRSIAKDTGPIAIDFTEVTDADLHIANGFKALKTPHAFLVGPSGEILYSGGITDRSAPGLAERYYLRDVLAAFDANKEIPWKKTRTLGCLIRGS